MKEKRVPTEPKAAPVSSEAAPIAEEPLYNVGGRMVGREDYLAALGTAPSPASSPTESSAGAVIGAGLTLGSSVPEPGPLTDDERSLVWAHRASRT